MAYFRATAKVQLKDGSEKDWAYTFELVRRDGSHASIEEAQIHADASLRAKAKEIEHVGKLKADVVKVGDTHQEAEEALGIRIDEDGGVSVA
jgi:hypothetical protein